MTEPTPPPERPMSTESRARIRADLVQYAHQDRSSAPRWVVPAGAAAAVAVVAGLAYWAINPGTSDRGLPVTGGGSSSAPVTPSASDSAAVPTPPPTSPPASSPSSVPSTELSTPASENTVEVGTRSCEEEMEYVLKGAQLALRVDAHSAFYVKGDRFVLCDIREGVTTVQQPMPLTPRDDAATYAVSTLATGGPGHRTIRVGGGLVPDGLMAFDVAYTFPDGHTERATTATDDQGRTWWRMTYTYDDGGGNELDQPQIEVTLSLIHI